MIPSPHPQAETMMTSVEEIAAGLSKRAKRAIPCIGDDWTQDGESGLNWKDAYSLWWGNSNVGLVEKPKFVSTAGNGTWAWKLTPVGLEVRAYLTGAGRA